MDTIYCNIRVIYKIKLEILIFYNINKNLKFYQTLNKYPLCIVGNNSKDLFLLFSICHHTAYFSLYHLLYLGKEISKAEIAMLIGQSYVQE